MKKKNWKLLSAKQKLTVTCLPTTIQAKLHNYFNRIKQNTTWKAKKLHMDKSSR